VAEALIVRGLRSTLALLAVLVGLGAYIYFGGAEKSSDPPAEKVFKSLESAKVEELLVKSESGDLTTLKKEGDAWKIVAPIAAAAAESDASGIANALADLSIARVVEENPGDVKEYGLDAPRVQVDFKAEGGKKTGRLIIGSRTATGGNLYVRHDDDKRVLLVPQFHEATFNKSTFDLRDKAIVKFDRAKVDGLDVTVAGAAGKALELKKADGEWKLTTPVAARGDSSAAEGLVSALESAQMKAVVSAAPTPEELKKYGLDKPQVTVNAHLGSARATLLAGAKAADSTVYVRDASRPDVFTIEATTVDGFKKPADDYRKKDLFDFRAFTATRVELARADQTIVFERIKGKDAQSPDTWRRASPNAADADREKVEKLLSGLADIRAVSFVDKNAKTGLNAPALTVVAKFDEGKKEERVTFGKNGADAFAIRPDDPTPSKVDATKLDEALKALDELSK
jgi:hypothetical protein